MAKMHRKHQSLKDQLSKLSGAEFDRAYMRQMVKDHEDAVKLFQRESTRGKDAELKAWAGKTLPALQEHLRLAREINTRVGGGSSRDKDKDNPNNPSKSDSTRNE
jgi:putative membrane protein